MQVKHKIVHLLKHLVFIKWLDEWALGHALAGSSHHDVSARQRCSIVTDFHGVLHNGLKSSDSSDAVLFWVFYTDFLTLDNWDYCFDHFGL